MLISDFKDYRHLLQHALDLKKAEFGTRFTMQKLADSCGVEKSYFSRVLRQQGHLNSQQLYLACRALNFTEEECRCSEVLMQICRAEDAEYCSYLKEQLQLMQRKFRASESHLTAQLAEVSQAIQDEYFLDPNLQLTHLFFSIPYYQSRKESVAQALGLSLAVTEHLISRLAESRLVSIEHKKIVSVQPHMHLSASSKIFPYYRTNVRHRALTKMSLSDSKQHYNFNVFFTADETTKQAIHCDFLKFLARTEALVKKSKRQKVYQLVFDCLDWG